jgi:ubiquinone/menaquinone biosynthesis C-methylase UbiE
MKLFNKKHNDHAKLYDLGMKLHWLGTYQKFRKSIIENFGDFKDKTILDFGCGTGLLLEFIKKNYSFYGFYLGCDPGHKMLEVAKRRGLEHGSCIFMQISENPLLPIRNSAVDIFVSSLVTHQISHGNKIALFQEIYRILKPNGKIVMAEFGKPTNLLGKFGAFYVKSIWGKIIPEIRVNIIDNLDGQLPDMLKKSGFSEVMIVKKWKGFVEVIKGMKGYP